MEFYSNFKKNGKLLNKALFKLNEFVERFSIQ